VSVIEFADVAHGDLTRLEDVVDRETLALVCRSFFDLFGLSIRVFSSDGLLLADVHEERTICRYMNTLPGGRSECGRTVASVKNTVPRDGIELHPCFTGAVYRVVPIDYQGRQVGRFVIGPFLPGETIEVPKTLLAIDAGVDPARARSLLAEMPRVRRDTAERITTHLSGVLDMLLFSSHRAHLTSEMHVASVRESFRELAEKTARLQEAFDRLRELDRLKSNFLATVSHELRTPLTSIIGYSEMLESGIAGDLSAEQREFVQTIRSKGDQLLALITSLLDLGKLEQGSLRLARDPIDPKSLIEDVVATMRPLAQRKDVAIGAEAPDGLPPIDGDVVRLKQVLGNLVENAVKFTSAGGSVRLTARESELEPAEGGGRGAVLLSMPRRAVSVAVIDTGIGIPEADRERIFDAFYQVDGGSTREHGGAGLGLSIVKRLVDAHGGRIEVRSKLGEGTTMTVTFVAVDRDA
jgi:signal transduction histidine kinase